MRLLTFFERRKLGDLQSRFGPPGTLMVTFTTSVVRGIMDRVIVVWGGVVMMLLYGGYLTWMIDHLQRRWSVTDLFNYLVSFLYISLLGMNSHCF
ncbi:hypothetical protein D1338_24435 [Salmonella enterica subsp. enterica serovar Kentucky]|nr:hypothetical protein [Salmonella enterica subsp. enterica serovar Kentucky]ECV0703487.1 hypothetical protein [Salmonella enterica subsp. enterica serovar Kentucky]